MKTFSGVLGACSVLLLLAAMGSAGIAKGWFDAGRPILGASWSVLLGLAVASGLLSAVLNRQSKKPASDSPSRD